MYEFGTQWGFWTSGDFPEFTIGCCFELLGGGLSHSLCIQFLGRRIRQQKDRSKTRDAGGGIFFNYFD